MGSYRLGVELEFESQGKSFRGSYGQGCEQPTLEKTLMLGKIEGRRRGDNRG